MESSVSVTIGRFASKTDKPGELSDRSALYSRSKQKKVQKVNAYVGRYCKRTELKINDRKFNIWDYSG